MRCIIALIFSLAVCAGNANAATFAFLPDLKSSVSLNYTGAGLVASVPDGAVTNLTLSFKAMHRPRPGGCVKSDTLTAYSDGARTLASLEAAGFKVVRPGEGRIVSAEVCLNRAGTVLTGSYAVLFLYSNSVVTVELAASNRTGNGLDELGIDEYLGGDPHVLEADASLTPGSWTVTPFAATAASSPLFRR
jgi:hypothetical protein